MGLKIYHLSLLGRWKTSRLALFASNSLSAPLLSSLGCCEERGGWVGGRASSAFNIAGENYGLASNWSNRLDSEPQANAEDGGSKLLHTFPGFAFLFEWRCRGQFWCHAQRHFPSPLVVLNFCRTKISRVFNQSRSSRLNVEWGT